jgi:hypothetical protein
MIKKNIKKSFKDWKSLNKICFWEGLYKATPDDIKGKI